MKESLDKINKVIQPYLDEEDNAFKVMSRSKYGHSSHGFITVINGEVKIHDKLNKAHKKDKLEEVGKIFTELLKAHGSVHGKSVFYFRRGEDAVFKDFTLEDAIEDVIVNTRRAMIKNGIQKVQTCCGFYLDDDFLNTDCRTSRFNADDVETINSGAYTGMYEECEVIYRKLGNGLREILFEITENSCEIYSNPPQSDRGWKEISSDSFQISKKLAERHDAIKESIKLREEAYRKIGRIDDTVFAPIISPIFMGGCSWPGGRPQYRLIQTAKSTLIITDGISNCFENEKIDAELQYNGYGVEFYMEFKGELDFADFQGHYSHAILGQVSQSAIRHGKFVDLFNKFGPISIQLSGIDLPKKYIDKEGNCGVLMLVPSENVPSEIKLNKENVLLVGCRLISATELKKCANDPDHSAKKQLVEKFTAKKEFCFSPFVPDKKA
jgi:hypothetical protein